ncbi:MAG: TonB-dependent receptor [Bacteroidales bacterium]|nr:TonB-dependent receptor [Bacteroidales bacterium]
MNKILTTLLILLSFSAYSQKIKLYGTITNSKGTKIPGVTIRAIGTNYFASSDYQGYYELKLPENESLEIVFSYFSVENDTVHVKTSTVSIKMNKVLGASDYELSDIYINANFVDEGGQERISTKSLNVLPDISGNGVETLIKTGMGVASSNELSSQYNVRGGNFDENLIYVNDILIYRPFLIRSGQQEGLSFINSDLVDVIKFSAGGFDAKYDDKMSSVLDITYKTPTEFAASLAFSMLGGTAHIENVSKNGKLSYIAGLRHKQSQYLLKTLEVQGDYKPVFTDFQLYSTYKFNDKFSISFLSNIASNIYNFVPTYSETSFGTFNQTLGISVYYEGQEKDSYQTFFGSFTGEYKANQNLRFKFIASSYYTIESENYDIDAYYSLNELNNQLDSTETVGDSILNLGFGQYLTHARNHLNAFISDASIKGFWTFDKHFLQFGVKYQREQISDILSEWKYVDSAGFSTNPQHLYPSDKVVLYNSTKAENTLLTNRLSAYAQDGYFFNMGFTKVKITYGARVSYNDYNNEILVSPRFSSLITPDWDNKWFFRLSTGIYYQSPFYRELRLFDGTLVENQKSQRSFQIVGGAYHTMKIWHRPFKLSTEIYYKKLDNLIPYELDNMRIRYYADQKATGYAVGADFKLYGEFVPGTDSWISLSLLKTMEDVEGDFYYNYNDSEGEITYLSYEIVDSALVLPGFIPRPSDQRVSVGMFFQDYVPGNKDFKVNLAFFFSTSSPFGPPQTARYTQTLRSFAPYMRADIGFSYLLKSPERKYKEGHFLNIFKSIWAQVELFNLMGIRNIAAYNWLELVPNTSNPTPTNYDMIAVPNRLTGRLFNFKLTFNF